MIDKAYFERQALKDILEQEFHISTNGWKEDEYSLAEASFFVFDNVEIFLKDTGWGLDNPDISGERYLTENRICRWIDGKFVYFSRLLWEGKEQG